MRTVLVQLNFIIGDIKYNTGKILQAIEHHSKSADLIIFSELSITGYPPMDLLENKKLIDDNIEAAQIIANKATDCAVIFGFVDRGNDGILFNSSAFAANGRIIAKQPKRLLPTYDVFDEHRYFKPADQHTVVEYMGKRIGMTVCEDIWNYSETEDLTYTDYRRYNEDPTGELAKQGVDLLVNISASPFVLGKSQLKYKMISSIAKKFTVPVLYVNQVGGNDSLIFDGNSMVYNANGELFSYAPQFEEGYCIFDETCQQIEHRPENELEDLEKALCLGLRDYVQKCGFKKTVLGLSGGIDSALTAALAVKALGSENVMGITMPSMFSSKGSVDDSVKLARNLDIEIHEIPIKSIYNSYNDSLSTIFAGLGTDVTEENLQARIRGTILMAASNKFGALLLTTGNKSELAMGYCTLYGDMNGGLAVISDLAKTTVYKLAHYINRHGELIPENTITKPPSAELRDDQKDEDTLPPYEILDGILKEYVENKKGAAEIVDLGYNKETVDFVLNAVNRNEYKRRQAAPGLKVTSKAFGTGRRVPMAQRYSP
jgi:NAD+ synthase (glutamine-hydrolysing)